MAKCIYVAFGQRIGGPSASLLLSTLPISMGLGNPQGMLDFLLLFSLAVSTRDTGDIRMVNKVVTFDISDLLFASLIFAVTD